MLEIFLFTIGAIIGIVIFFEIFFIVKDYLLKKRLERWIELTQAVSREIGKEFENKKNE